MRRFFRQLDHAAVGGKLGHAELLGIGHLGQQDLAVAIQCPILLDERRDAVLQQVVAKVHHKRCVAQELLRVAISAHLVRLFE